MHITFRNLRHRGAATFDPNTWVNVPLDGQGTVTVRGENLDAGGSNEAGKSALFYPIPNIFFFTTPGGLKSKRKHIAMQDYEAVIDYAVGDTEISIHQFFTKKEDGYLIYINGEDKTPEGGILACEAKIKELFPLTEDEYYSYVHVSPHKFHTLAKGKLGERLSFIHSAFSLDAFDFVHEELKAEAKKIDDKLRTLEHSTDRLRELKAKVRDYKDSETLDTELKDAKRKRRRLMENRTRLRKELSEAERLLRDKKRRSKTEKQLKEVKYDEHTNVDEQIVSLEAELSDLDRVITQWESHRKAIAMYDRYKGYEDFDATDLEENIDVLTELISNRKKENKFIAKRIKLQRECENLPQVDVKASRKEHRSLIKRAADCDRDIKDARTDIGFYESLDKPKCPTCGQRIDQTMVRGKLRSARKKLKVATTARTEARSAMKSIESSIRLSEKRANLEAIIATLPEGDVRQTESLQERLNRAKTRLKRLNRAVTYRKALKGVTVTEKAYSAAQSRRKVVNNIVGRLRTAKSLQDQLKALSTTKEPLASLRRAKKTVERQINVNDNAITLVEQSLVTLKHKRTALRELTSEIEDFERKAEQKQQYDRLHLLYKALLQAYGPRGLKVDRIREIMSTIADEVNRFAPILFTDPIMFSHEKKDELATLMFQRKQGKRIDVRHLSSGATRKFILALIPAFAQMIAPEKRTNLVILDEVDANIDKVGQEIFVDNFIPLMAKHFSTVFAITPYDNVIAGSQDLIVQKRNGVSVLKGGRP